MQNNIVCNNIIVFIKITRDWTLLFIENKQETLQNKILINSDWSNYYSLICNFVTIVIHKQSFIKNDKIEICNTFYNIISFIERETQI